MKQSVPWCFFFFDVTFHYLVTTWCDFSVTPLCHGDVVAFPRVMWLKYGVSSFVLIGCRYYIRSALPFGSPVNTNFHLLRMVRCHGCNLWGYVMCVLHFLLEVATKIADCTVLRWIVLLTWLGFQILEILETKLIIWERFQNSQWCCQAWFPQQRGWHKSTKPRLEAIPVQRKVQIDFVPWPCKASQMLQAHLKHVVFQAWNTWVPSR